MLGGASPVAFLATTDGERARAFYADTLGIPFIADEGVALVFDLRGTALRVTRIERLAPQPFTVLGWRVEDATITVRELARRGVTFERYPQLEQDELGIWTSPSGARVAWFKDPDGNLLSVTSSA